jgi:hypothetical protein
LQFLQESGNYLAPRPDVVGDCGASFKLPT